MTNRQAHRLIETNRTQQCWVNVEVRLRALYAPRYVSAPFGLGPALRNRAAPACVATTADRINGQRFVIVAMVVLTGYATAVCAREFAGVRQLTTSARTGDGVLRHGSAAEVTRNQGLSAGAWVANAPPFIDHGIAAKALPHAAAFRRSADHSRSSRTVTFPSHAPSRVRTCLPGTPTVSQYSTACLVTPQSSATACRAP